MIRINLRDCYPFYTTDHLQSYMDLLSFGGTNPDGTKANALSVGYIRLYSAVLQGSFRFAVFPKRLISFNHMQYVRGKKEVYELFSDENGNDCSVPTITYEQYLGVDRVSESQRQSSPVAYSDRVLHRASHWRGLRADMAEY